MSVKRLARTITLLAVVLACSSAASHGQHSTPVDPPLRVRFAESVRRETQITAATGNQETVPGARVTDAGQISIEFELTMTDEARQALTGATEVSVEAGSFLFNSSFDKDPAYKAGKTSTTLKETEKAGTGGSHPGTAVLRLRWERGTVFGKLEARIPDSNPIAAAAFLRNNEGELFAQPTVRIKIGGTTSQVRVSADGTLTRSHSNNGSHILEVENIRLHGETLMP